MILYTNLGGNLGDRWLMRAVSVCMGRYSAVSYRHSAATRLVVAVELDFACHAAGLHGYSCLYGVT